MRVLFISANREEINMLVVPMGLGCVAESTRRAGHDVRLLDLMAEPDIQSAIEGTIREFEPNIIGVSVRNIDDQNMEDPSFLLDQAREVISCCRKVSKAHIVLGGAGYSMFPQSALKYLEADMGIQGEGEIAFPALLNCIQGDIPVSGVPGLYLPDSGLQERTNYIRDLDAVPFPDPALLADSDVRDEAFLLPFQTRRGCPLNCSYCSTSTIEGRLIRRRSADNVIRELVRWREAGFSRFFFVDNTFNLPPGYAMDFCSGLADAGLDISWRCILYPGKVSEDLVRAMSKAGCSEVSLGFESGCQKILDGMNKRFSTESIRRASRMLESHGIRQMGFLLLGGPGETKKTVEESFEFVESLPLDALRITSGIRIYPDTDLAKLAVEEGKIPSETDLLFPRFYMVEGLENWVRQTVKERAKDRPNWIC
ncbi:MAG: radical SAM protein [Deltaproteobacteria bacterium]|nr:radical SAM protein [Deltaproteobacteria bacterium]